MFSKHIFACAVPGCLLLAAQAAIFKQEFSLEMKRDRELPADSGPRSAIELYFQAHAFGNGDCIKEAFTPDAKISFVDNGQLKQWTREEFAARFHGPADDEYRRVRRVESLDVNGTAASAVVTLDYPQVLFRDHLALLKIGDEWKIVNKVFSAERRDVGKVAMDDTLKNWTFPLKPRKIVGNMSAAIRSACS
jgi:hypothetical protein